MEALKIVLTSLLSIAELFILTKLMGKRQISELNFFDYICGITIGSISAEMAIEPLKEFWKPAIAVAVYALVAVGISLITTKSCSARRVLSGKSTVLINNGKIYDKALKKTKMDLNELLMLCRINGYFNVDELKTVILEPNGKLSFLPKSDSRPLMPKDVSISPIQDQTFATLIVDGTVLDGNLKAIGKEHEWLKKQLNCHGIEKEENALLAVCDESGNFICYQRQKGTMSRDIFS